MLLVNTIEPTLQSNLTVAAASALSLIQNKPTKISPDFYESAFRRMPTRVILLKAG